jgi:hypothetical protein
MPQYSYTIKTSYKAIDTRLSRSPENCGIVCRIARYSKMGKSSSLRAVARRNTHCGAKIGRYCAKGCRTSRLLVCLRPDHVSWNECIIKIEAIGTRLFFVMVVLDSNSSYRASLRRRILSLPPGLHQLIRDGLNEVGDRGAVAGLDEGLDWHAGH